MWRTAVSRASVVQLNQDWAIFPGSIHVDEENYTCSQRSRWRTCLKKLLTLSVGDTLKHAQSSAGSPQIVFSSDCPEGTAALQLMRTLCDWTDQHRKTGLLHVLMALQRCVCREQPNITFKSIWSVLFLPQDSNYCIHKSLYRLYVSAAQQLVTACHSHICGFCNATWNSSSYAEKHVEALHQDLLCCPIFKLTQIRPLAPSEKLFDSQSDMNFAFRCFCCHISSILKLLLWFAVI